MWLFLTIEWHKKQKKIFQTIIFIFWDFLMFYQIFLSPQVKWCAFTTYKHGIYELPHDLVALDLVPNIPRIIVNTQENWRTRENWLEQ